MKWLLWKDYRHNRLIVFATLCFLLAPYLFAAGVAWWTQGNWTPVASKWAFCCAGAALYSTGFSGMGLALIAGNAIAGERVDRSAEFLFTLPVARKRLVASKLLLALAIAAAPWLINLSVLWSLSLAITLPPNNDVLRILEIIALAEVTAFCISWFVSSLTASSSFATLAGLLTPLAVFWSLANIVAILQNWPPNGVNDSFVFFCWMSICLTLAAVCFAGGTWYYLRRAEP